MRKRRLKYLILHDARYTFAFGAILGVILAFIVHLIKSNPPFLESVWPAQIHSKSKEDLTYDDASALAFVNVNDSLAFLCQCQ